ncbi:hypothetical protein A2U01_0070630, partial [Trifolium medium]|nr:hypothetical protein [Trifolium medium]
IMAAPRTNPQIAEALAMLANIVAKGQRSWKG